MWRASVNVAKGYRQFQKADKAMSNDKLDSALSHLKKGLEFFGTAVDHAAKAEDDAFTKAGSQVAKANANMQKSLDAYAAGNLDSAANLYSKALDEYDAALDLIG
jgi:hypothetical protein